MSTCINFTFIINFTALPYHPGSASCTLDRTDSQ